MTARPVVTGANLDAGEDRGSRRLVLPMKKQCHARLADAVRF